MTPIESAALIDEILGNSDWKDDLLARFAPGTRIVSAMSGGVDSSVATALLAAAGFEVVGVSMRLGSSGARAAGPFRMLFPR